MSTGPSGPVPEADMQTPLGRSVEYTGLYTPSLLFPMPRVPSAAVVPGPGNPPDGGSETLPVSPPYGEDVWNGYEFTWLDRSGKPVVSGLRLRIPAHSPCIVESKSLKLYLGSFAQTRFNGQADVLRTLDSDLRIAVRAPLLVELVPLRQLDQLPTTLPGVCLDEIDCECSVYQTDASLLRMEGQHTVVHETVYSHLFRSICPVTGQPDYGTVWISYRGYPVARKSLLQYLVSYRQHGGFHESVVEQVWQDLRAVCQPQSLSVQGFFQRRGGLDINPYRSSGPEPAMLIRLARQ